ncbi:MAG TPA: glutaredoxin family protein [Candidatus Acidoferrum sp.]|nr:glutaredoxin family protein [Candidatus Acidoferrum sp.]
MDPLAQRILSTFDQLERDSLDLHTLFEFVGGNPPEERNAVLDKVFELIHSGLLRDDGGDFYSRTEDGRIAVAAPRDVTLYTREACHLCDEAKAIIAPLVAEFCARLREVDVDDDPVLHDRYTNDVPVIFVGSQFFAQHRVDPARLRRRLEQASAASQVQ